MSIPAALAATAATLAALALICALYADSADDRTVAARAAWTLIVLAALGFIVAFWLEALS